MIYLIEINTAKDVRMFKEPTKDLAVSRAITELEKDGLASTIMTCTDDLEGGKLMPILSINVPQVSNKK